MVILNAADGKMFEISREAVEDIVVAIVFYVIIPLVFHVSIKK